MDDLATDTLEKLTRLNWVTAKGIRQNRPILIRFRDVPLENGMTSCGNLVVVTYAYSVEEDTGLPTPRQYDGLRDFESRVFNSLESAKMAVLVYITTNNGKVDYFVYSSRTADDLLSFLGDQVSPDDPVSFAETEDPEWEQYRIHRSRVR